MLHPILILCALAAALILCGFVFGRYIFPAIPAPSPVPTYDLPDHVLARIVYEARRAYRAALGVMDKSWNNLDPDKRTRLIGHVSALRAIPDAIGADVESSLIVAVTRVATPTAKA